MKNSIRRQRKWPKGVPFPDRETCLSHLEKAGGDPAYIEWLEGWTSDAYPANWSTKNAKRLSQQAARLRRDIQSSGVFMQGTERYIQTLRDLEKEAKGMGEGLGEHLRNLFHPQKGCGTPLKQIGMHRWLGALVPYTAYLKPSAGPYWPWIVAWLAHRSPKAPSGRKLWDKNVASRLKSGKPINLTLVKHYREASGLFFYYRCSQLKNRKRAYERPWTIEQTKYLAAILKHMPFLEDSIGTAGCYAQFPDAVSL